MKEHRRALTIVAIAIVLDAACGLGFSVAEHVKVTRSLYWALATATTVGYGDIFPKTTAGHLITILVMLTVIPLFAATFSLLTTSLTAKHVRSEGQQAQQRLDQLIDHHATVIAHLKDLHRKQDELHKTITGRG